MSTSSTLYSVLDLPPQERPRERLMHQGPEAMSSAELIAIILGCGVKGTPVLQLAHDLLSRFGSLHSLAEASLEEMAQIRGLGVAKAIQLKAAISLGMRISQQSASAKVRIEHPAHAYHLVKDVFQFEKREVVLVLLQDSKGGVISQQTIAIGSLASAIVHPRQVFFPAVRQQAASLILIHNHPSGDPTPSPEDIETTETLIKVGLLMGTPLNDHLIIGNNSYISLRQKGVNFLY
jgi:DNA repair protein RadC